MPRFIDANIEFVQSSGLVTGSSGVFFQDTHLDESISLSEIDHTQLSGFATESIVGALNELQDSPASNAVDARAVTGAIIPDTSGVYPLGNFDSPFLRLAGVSGIFTDRVRFDPKGEDPVAAADVNVMGDVWLRQNRSQRETLAVVGESGIRGIRTDQGFFYYRTTSDLSIATIPDFTDIPLTLEVVHDTPYYVIEENDTVVLVVPGIYRVTYSVPVVNFEIDAFNRHAVVRTLLNDTEVAHGSGCCVMGQLYVESDGNFGHMNNSFLINANAYDKIKFQAAEVETGSQIGIESSVSIQLLRYNSP
ncbi:MAG: hypothetical protein ACXABY_01760 [Candidatus Thorarchaeota archaeon]|jgi:hypothetical protein